MCGGNIWKGEIVNERGAENISRAVMDTRKTKGGGGREEKDNDDVERKTDCAQGSGMDPRPSRAS